MTGKNESDRIRLNRLSDSLADDILNMSDEEILVEFREDGGDPERNAAELRALFEKTLLLINKGQMVTAKAGAAVSRRSNLFHPAIDVDITTARELLRSVIERNKDVTGLTLAARNESDLSDADVRSMLEDFAELGLLDPGVDEGKT